MKPYDYLIVGSGLFGAVFAHEAHKAGKRCLVIEKRPHTGGNIYCEEVDGINVHKYGAHIFHTDNREVWNYVNRLVEFNRYTNSPIANYKGKLYNLPFNMNTFYQCGEYVLRQSPGKDTGTVQGIRAYNPPAKPGRTGTETLRRGHLPATDKRIHGETVGTPGNRASGIYHPAHSVPVYLRQQLLQRPVSGHSHGRI